MNYVLDTFFNQDDVLESNTTYDELKKLFDNQYSTKCYVPNGESYLYLKLPFSALQYVVFHNISSDKVKIEVYDNSDNLLESTEKTTLKSAGLTYCDVIDCKRTYYDYDLLFEVEKQDQGGYIKVYVYPIESVNVGWVGRIDWGVPEWLGCLNWGFSFGGKAATMPIVDLTKAIIPEDRVIAWDTYFSMVLSHFRTRLNEPDQNAAYTISKLKRLFVAHKETIITGYDDENNPVTKVDWVMKKTTFIEPTVTKQVGWFAIENYEATGKNAVTTQIKVNLKGFKDGKDGD